MTAVLPELLLVASAAALLVVGAAVALSSSNAVKRIAGVGLAGLGALAGLAALHAPEGMLLAGVAILFAHLVLAVAVNVRLQESYATIEAGEIDSADAQDEPEDQRT